MPHGENRLDQIEALGEKNSEAIAQNSAAIDQLTADAGMSGFFSSREHYSSAHPHHYSGYGGDYFPSAAGAHPRLRNPGDSVTKWFERVMRRVKVEKFLFFLNFELLPVKLAAKLPHLLGSAEPRKPHNFVDPSESLAG
jgi:hypothetical protein